MSRFGGHETFHVREGWLPKAIMLLDDDPALFKDPLACDRLGVGRSMAKSIDHWLQVTNLLTKGGRNEPPAITNIGKLILREDPYFLRAGTWWALHINIANGTKDALAWRWFFNRSYPDRFDRDRFMTELDHQLRIAGERPPSPTTLRKDVSCMLASYSTPIPPAENDPEEGLSCPFQSLGLITHLRETDSYHVNRKTKHVPSELIGYAFSVSMPGLHDGKHRTMSVTKAYGTEGGPGKTLSLDMEAFLESLERAEKDLGSKKCHVELAGGERTVRFIDQEPAKWLEDYFEVLAW